ncbi:MAG TPA: PqqD family protein [Terriglobales bacterium]|nr:PqqD family protein [Terriglobales bacterium]
MARSSTCTSRPVTQVPPDRFVRSRSVVARGIGGELLIVPVRRGVGDLTSLYSLNGSGATLWEALAAEKTAAELAGVLEQDYDLAGRDARADVERFLREMSQLGLVQCAPAPADPAPSPREPAEGKG